MTSDIIERMKKRLLIIYLLKLVPDDISSLTKFLASDKASYITGQTFHVNEECSCNIKV